MAPSSSPPEASHRQRRGRRQSSSLARLSRFWQGWRAEIVVVVLLVLAALLLVERINLRETLYGLLLAALGGLESLVSAIAQRLVGFVRATSISDLMAYGLLVVAIVLLGWRTRYRVAASPRLTGKHCPRCGGDLYRIHRRWSDRLLNVLIPVRRYRCKDQACGWHGLRVKHAG